jgi:putative endonuclease
MSREGTTGLSASPRPQDRRTAGANAEQLAARHLEQLGYTIIERNFHCRGGELDLVAWQGATLCFIEVRSRKDERFGSPLDTIGSSKRRRIATAARAYLRARRPPRCEMRFDVVAVCGGVVSAVIADAFRTGEP